MLQSGTSSSGPVDYLSYTPADVKSLSRSRKVQLIKEIVSQAQRCPQLVFLVTTDLLKSGGSGLGDDTWFIREQRLIAALQHGHQQDAVDEYAALLRKFGKKSIRVKRLAGLIREARGTFPEAKSTYMEILKTNKSDAFVVKRLSAIRKAEGDYAGAIAELEENSQYRDEDNKACAFMDFYAMDVGAIRELTMLHLLASNVPRAMHYAEEAILIEPHLYVNHVRYAEICYQAGKLELAATSYCHALKLNDGCNSARSLYGLWMVTLELIRRNEKQEVAGADAVALRDWTVSRLRQLYAGGAMASALDLMLAARSS